MAPLQSVRGAARRTTLWTKMSDTNFLHAFNIFQPSVRAQQRLRFNREKVGSGVSSLWRLFNEDKVTHVVLGSSKKLHLIY